MCYINDPLWHASDSLAINYKKQIHIPDLDRLYQSSKTIILPHLAGLLRSEELDELGQCLAGGAVELACGFGDHGLGEDGEEGRGQGDYGWVGLLVCLIGRG